MKHFTPSASLLCVCKEATPGAHKGGGGGWRWKWNRRKSKRRFSKLGRRRWRRRWADCAQTKENVSFLQSDLPPSALKQEPAGGDQAALLINPEHQRPPRKIPSALQEQMAKACNTQTVSGEADNQEKTAEGPLREFLTPAASDAHIWIKKSLFLCCFSSPKEDPFPEWLVDLMINIEEAKSHPLVVE